MGKLSKANGILCGTWICSPVRLMWLQHDWGRELWARAGVSTSQITWGYFKHVLWEENMVVHATNPPKNCCVSLKIMLPPIPVDDHHFPPLSLCFPYYIFPYNSPLFPYWFPIISILFPLKKQQIAYYFPIISLLCPYYGPIMSLLFHFYYFPIISRTYYFTIISLLFPYMISRLFLIISL